MTPPLLLMSGIHKRFGRTVALDDVSLSVAPGEIHALVGENGAGKSTLMQVLTGAQLPDSGQIALAGQALAPRRPLDSLRAGIACVYQDFNLAPHLSIQANLLLGRERTFLGLLLGERGAGENRRLCRQTLRRLGVALPLDTPVGRLGIADQQLVEIARVLMGRPRLIVMDEPTSALAAHEAQRLFAILRQLRAQGLSIIYISHFLEELEQIADSVTVLRDGRTAGAGPLSRWPRPRIIEAMVGRGVDQMYVRVPHAIGPQLLRIDGLSGRPLPRSANLVLHQGEILGIAGLVGAGRTQMLRALFGLDPAIGGTAWVAGVRVAHFRPSIWMRRGMCLLSEDRKTEGLAQGLSCRANMTLPVLGRMSRLGFVRAALERRESRRIGRRLGVRWDGPDQPVGSLSGGNQQKVAMARLLLLDADVLLLDEPTRGIDVAAKVDLYRAIGELAARGKGIVVVSSYVPELLGICDRIAVMSRGVLSEAFETARMSARRIMQLAVGEYGSDSI